MMTRFTLDINCDNAAFDWPSEAQTAEELGRILTKLGQSFTQRRDGPEVRDSGKLLDLNGNGVGRWNFERGE